MADGEGAQSGAEGTQSGAGESTTDSTASTTSGEGAQSGASTTTVDTADLERRAGEADSLRERMRAADQRAATFEKELRQLREKDMPEAEKLKRDFEETQKQVAALTERNSTLAVENAFLKDNTFAWHNPDAARKLVDLSQVQLNDDGTVTGMKEALKALAAAHPYLMKPDVKEEPKTPPGTSPGNNGGGRSGPATPTASRFPVMRTRVKAQ